MRKVVQTVMLHLACILFFAFFYYYFSIHFDNNKQNKSKHYKSESKLESIIDFFLFSTTIQAGVGISDILPNSVYGKLLMILQQLILISISVITLYVFTR
uniref:Potassium channel domain-containing protein n=1 Tax=viral metagenome TaxID=1070528 RepID=A0A6C0HFZ7_9ZZZZ